MGKGLYEVYKHAAPFSSCNCSILNLLLFICTAWNISPLYLLFVCIQPWTIKTSACIVDLHFTAVQTMDLWTGL